jgi:hypothetical protein
MAEDQLQRMQWMAVRELMEPLQTVSLPAMASLGSERLERQKRTSALDQQSSKALANEQLSPHAFPDSGRRP